LELLYFTEINILILSLPCELLRSVTFISRLIVQNVDFKIYVV